MSTFITFEGIEGAGKSSQLLLLEAELVKLGYSCYLTAEPSDAYNRVRQSRIDKIDPVEDCLSFILDRRRHLLAMQKHGAFDSGIILCDRFIDSTTVYQGIAGIHPTTLDTMNRLALYGHQPGEGFPMPDLTLWLDVPIEIALERIMARGDKPYAWNSRTGQDAERILKDLTLHRQAYQMVARRYPDRIVRIDASKHPNLVLEEILAHVKPLLERKFRQIAK